jgi:hypothetical protein
MPVSLLEPLKIADAVIDRVQGQDRPCHSLKLDSELTSRSVTDDDLYRLQHVFPEQTILGALDLIDRGNGTQPALVGIGQ